MIATDDSAISKVAQLWQAGQPDAAVAVARAQVAARADDAQATGLLVRTLAALPAACPPERLTLALSWLDEALATGGATDDLVYARGLAQWRMGAATDALATWHRLSDAARAQIAPLLDGARIAHAVELAGRGALGEAAVVLAGVSDAAVPQAAQARRAVAAAASRAGMPGLARLVSEQLCRSTASADQALAALLAPAGEERLAHMLDLQARAPATLRRALLRAAAIEALRAGRGDLLAGLAAGLPDDGDLQAMTALAQAAGADGAAAEAARHAPALAGRPDIVAASLGTPDPEAAADEQASFWLASGQHAAAAAALAGDGDAWEPERIRARGAGLHPRLSGLARD